MRRGLDPAHISLIERYHTLHKVAHRSYLIGDSHDAVMHDLESLRNFFAWLGKDPDEAVSLKISWSDAIIRYVEYLLGERKMSRTSVACRIGQVKKWLYANEIEFNNNLPRIKKWVVERDRTPTREELSQIVSKLDLRDKVVVLISVSSGMRLATIIRLKLRDVSLENRCPLIYIRPENAKNRLPNGYITFLTPEAKRYLLQYLNQRTSRGEELTSVTQGSTPESLHHVTKYFLKV